MREILLRSYDEELESFYYFFNGKYYSDIDLTCELEPSFHDMYFNWNNAEYFTGLLDKNGNKIFEGDKFQGDEPGEFYIVNWNKEEAIFQMDLYGYFVSIGEGSQEVYDNEKSQIDSNCFELSALSSDVIIGNIHENQ